MTDLGSIALGGYSHDLLLHESDEELVQGTRAFVEQGLDSGGHVLVHSSKPRVEMLREALGSHPRLEYGLDEELYLTPTSTLFAYQKKFAEQPLPVDFWVTGTVPLGEDVGRHAAWSRYESLVNEVLGSYAFHALCTYDVAILPESTIAAAKATHQHVGTGVQRAASSEYQHPSDFLADPLADVPEPPDSQAVVSMTLRSLQHLAPARRLVQREVVRCSLTREAVDGFVMAVNEVLVNGLLHGGAPVQLLLWVGGTRLTCLVTDEGPGIGDRLAGYRYPQPRGPKGLWVARQLCQDLFVDNLPGGGCRVLVLTD